MGYKNGKDLLPPALLKAVLEEKGFFRVIVFARTRSRADTACRRLRRAGYAVEAIHSDRSLNQRKRALDKFSNGDVNIITATDVLARGIDVSDVDYVINYDVPEQPEDYIHRIGRTGRAGSQGFAVTFVTPETESQLRDIEKLIKQEIPEMQLRDFDMAAAEAEAAEKSITAQAKRDPEVNRAKRELANKARKKAELAAERQASREQEKRNKKNRSQQGQAQGKGKDGAKSRTSNQPGFNQGNRSKPQSQRRKKPQQSGDFRPGRARRAEVQRSRSRKKR